MLARYWFSIYYALSYCPQVSIHTTLDRIHQIGWMKVAVPGTKTVQPPPKWEMKCDWVTDTIPQCRVRGVPLLSVPDRVQAGGVHGARPQVWARPGQEVLWVQSPKVGSGKKTIWRLDIVTFSLRKRSRWTRLCLSQPTAATLWQRRRSTVLTCPPRSTARNEQ